MKTVFAAVNAEQVMIIDGSAITLVASHHLDYPQAQLVWTPHQIEWQQSSRLPLAAQTIEASQKAAAKIPDIIVAKSFQTHVFVDEDVYENIVGRPAMATGSSGDTLKGIIAPPTSSSHWTSRSRSRFCPFPRS